MSDVEPEVPDWLAQAILSEGPSAADLDVVKQALSWRTIDAELMQLSYDSADSLVGVRDAGEFRTLEFSLPDHTVVVEVGAGVVRGRVTPDVEGATVELHRVDGEAVTVALVGGAFQFDAVAAGSVHLRVVLTPGDAGTTGATALFRTGSFSVS